MPDLHPDRLQQGPDVAVVVAVWAVPEMIEAALLEEETGSESGEVPGEGPVDPPTLPPPVGVVPEREGLP